MELQNLAESFPANDCNLPDVNLSVVSLTQCQVTCMRIDGILVADLLAAYRKSE